MIARRLCRGALMWRRKDVRRRAAWLLRWLPICGVRFGLVKTREHRPWGSIDGSVWVSRGHPRSGLISISR